MIDKLFSNMTAITSMMTLVTNFIIPVITFLASSTIVWKIFNIIYDKYMPVGAVYVYAARAANTIGLYINQKLTRKIPDTEMKDKAEQFLHGLSDVIDWSWDQGIQGRKIQLTEKQIIRKAEQFIKEEGYNSPFTK